MHISSPVASIFIWWVCCGITASAFALPRTKEYRGSSEVVASKNAAAAEPTCEELKAMWRFSKRQSRAAEITNEIPMYRDPFSDNVWEPYYATSRSMGGLRLARLRGRHGPPPIYGKLVHKPPHPIFRLPNDPGRTKAFEAFFDSVQKQNGPRRRLTTFRLPGGGYPPQSGSFQHLKELIKTERARELQEQRMAEEVAVRNAAIKELSENEDHRGQGYRDVNYNYDVDDSLDEHSNYMGNRGGILAFPDLLAPASSSDRANRGDGRFMQDYSYTSRGRPRSYSTTLFDTSSFNNGYML